MSARNTRAKGVAFEREVADALEAAGFTVRGLEAGGDHLAVKGDRIVHVEAKRHERMQLPEWLRQQERDWPDGERVLIYRQSRRPMYVVQRFDQWATRQ